MANTDNAREYRFRIIETLLLWEGEVSNERIREVLGIKVVQASRVLSEYATLNPKQVVSENNRSPYRASSDIQPNYSQGSVEEYIALSKRFDGKEDIIVDARYDLTLPTPGVMSQIALSIKSRSGLVINYESMNHPKGQVRLIYPHAIVRAGRRWHIRAWCTDRHDFLDFVLGRIRKVALDPSEVLHDARNDKKWNLKVNIALRAHPAMSEDQIKVIRNEYFKGALSRRLSIRSCLIQYVLQDMRVATDVETQIPPEYQLAVANLEEIREYLFPAD